MILKQLNWQCRYLCAIFGDNETNGLDDFEAAEAMYNGMAQNEVEEYWKLPEESPMVTQIR